ncbi:GNAT family N-acetyltransferase [Pseudalkalibacillus salsuginis]|uniref:GNAT family N-acetyltransferase n=1 Tax=Pseudalkalibacillus salsuginis TaxID=2910972 RepID=UPI001F42E9F4|nr:GNAT family N-acetyltransferase [Pseudalkalibacillus salsuginis]MCF6411173.1 GNAT family N-acetyltransferase [Pseudalkalibacillus salsuginis]
MEYKKFTSLPDETALEHLNALHNRVFGSTNGFVEDLQTKHRPFILAAIENERVIGYKIGYERKVNHFYSWLGGVHPDYRGKGIGEELLVRQHKWCRENGYKTIRTHTKNQWRSMLILNIKNGFDVIGTFTDAKGETKIILEKRL